MGLSPHALERICWHDWRQFIFCEDVLYRIVPLAQFFIGEFCSPGFSKSWVWRYCEGITLAHLAGFGGGHNSSCVWMGNGMGFAVLHHPPINVPTP